MLPHGTGSCSCVHLSVPSITAPQGACWGECGRVCIHFSRNAEEQAAVEPLHDLWQLQQSIATGRGIKMLSEKL